jgi:serine phosphatase RsbU (regulator of sigma subunit)
MKNALIAGVCAIVLLLTNSILNAPTQAPPWSPAEIAQRFQQTARAMGVDPTQMKTDTAIEHGRLVVLANRKRAAARVEYAKDGRITRWDCTRCPALAGHPASQESVRPLFEGAPHITINDGVVLKASSDSGGGNATGRSFARAIHGISTAVFWIYFSLTFPAFFRLFRRYDLRRVAMAVTAAAWVAAIVTSILARSSADLPYGLFAVPFYWVLPCIAGISRLRAQTVGKWIGFLHAAERWRPARRTGTELWNGLLLAWPLALAARFADPTVNTGARNAVVLYFAFMVPQIALGRWIRDPKWRARFLVAIGVLLFAGSRPAASAYPLLDLLSGILVFGVAVWIYEGYGLLGVLTGAAASALLEAPWFAGVAIYGGALGGAAWLRQQGVAGEDRDVAAETLRRNVPEFEVEVRSERQALLTEFAEAREAQMGMLPARAPVIPGYSLAAVCVPAREVGGDLYDIIPFRDGSWGLCVADVSGKGVPAALYMTMTKGVLASEQRFTSDLRTLTLALNERLHQAAHKKIFVTMAFARLDPATRVVELVRAGHNPVLWRRAARGETVWLKPGGLGLGLAANKSFQRSLGSQTIELEPDDTLILYSDGLTEAENIRVELFGEDRLQDIVERSASQTAEGLVGEILAEVERFKEGADPHDDLTLVVLKAE